jgi:hypothetical protein
LRGQLPDFPWDALAPYGDIARSHQHGIIDLSQGTPVDSTPEFIQQAFRDAANSPSYPVTAGTPELRAAIKKWAIERLGARGDFDVLPVIGSKELVAWLPTILESKKVLIPEIAYPTYHLGAVLAGAESIPVAIDAQNWPTADLAWLNSPSNPTGRVHSDAEIKACIDWSRSNKALLVSDECYLEFEQSAHPVSVLSHTGGDNSNILDKSTAANGVNGFSLRYRNWAAPVECAHFQVNAGTARTSAANSIPQGVWTHLLLTVNSATTVTFYINGVVSGTPGTTGAIAGITTTNAPRIANLTGATTATFDGAIRSVKMWDRVLTAAEIAKDYAQEPVLDGLLHWFKLGGDYADYGNVGVAATNSGSVASAVDDTLAIDLKAKRVTANDKFFVIPFNDRVMDIAIEEAP